MAKKAKRFRIGVEGATTDGRTIERSWLEQMAANYDPAVYTAVINMEHIKGYTPDSAFRRFGVVDALDTEEISDGLLKGKLGLYAVINSTDELVTMTGNMQKLFTSMEIRPEFADTGEAYLIGLAVTDDPASLGTEMLQFSASAGANPLANRKQHPDNLFTAATETVIEFEDVADEKPSLFSRVSALFSNKQKSDDARFSDVHRAVELVATEQQAFSQRIETALSEQASSLQVQLSAEAAAREQLQADFSQLQEQLSREDGRQDYRPRTPGNGNSNSQDVRTDC
ncbi:GPO family capsid scaffolding protein [Serratia symbiotica]|uniref:GPO family capsid scaffolding protein n=1 Tax=Serratia symbiotica TaxID=138074 RepID=UPI00132BECEF|nr:GPO family capsid scaffolding protein [Serratia symbiotica]MBF1995789.1 GPO family capsid scaffolding protein [Serratia symbiotica]QTP13816.1 GPO family capsid scaffolding protein [Serratia symbiotica]